MLIFLNNSNTNLLLKKPPLLDRNVFSSTNYNYSVDSKRFSENLINYLTNFIKNDDPNQGLSNRQEKWEKFNGNNNYLSFSNKDKVMTRGGLESCKFWDDFNKDISHFVNNSNRERLSNFISAFTVSVLFLILVINWIKFYLIKIK